jgi:hypothetical protein
MSHWCVACERIGNYEEVCNSCENWGICPECISHGYTLFSFWHPPCVQIPRPAGYDESEIDVK